MVCPGKTLSFSVVKCSTVWFLPLSTEVVHDYYSPEKGIRGEPAVYVGADYRVEGTVVEIWQN